MNKFITLFVSLCCLTSLFAQPFQQGTHYLGGAAGSSLAGNTALGVRSDLGQVGLAIEEGGYLFVEASPVYGYFLTDKLVAGLGASFIALTDFDDGVFLLSAIPFARYYFGEISPNWQWYSQAGVGFSVQLDEPSNKQFPLELGLGSTYLLSPSVGIDLNLTLTDNDLSNTEDTWLFLSGGLNFYLDQSPWKANYLTAPSFGEGTIMVGGSVGLLGTLLKGGSNSAISLSPKVHYFLNDRLALGAGLNVDYRITEFTTLFQPTYTFRELSLGLSPQMRYYLGEPGKLRSWFLGTGLDILYSRSNVDSPAFVSNPESETKVNFAVFAGFNQFLTPNVAIEAGPGILIDPKDELIRLGFDLGIQVFLRNE